MDYEKLDQLFEEAFERVQSGKKPSLPHGNILAGNDHFLLKKSWEFFQKRMKSIEHQFQELLDSKNLQLKMLNKNLAETEKKEKEWEERCKEREKVEVLLTEARIKDFYDFKKHKQKVFETWEEERLALEETIGRLENQIRQAKDDLKEFKEKSLQREEKVKNNLEHVREENEKILLREANLLGAHKEELRLKDEEIIGYQMKIDLLRKEVESRNGMIRHLSETLEEIRKKERDLENQSLDHQLKIENQNKAMHNLEDKIDLLKEENDNLKKGWEHERSEWRELWDRQREMWDRRKP